MKGAKRKKRKRENGDERRTGDVTSMQVCGEIEPHCAILESEFKRQIREASKF